MVETTTTTEATTTTVVTTVPTTFWMESSQPPIVLDAAGPTMGVATAIGFAIFVGVALLMIAGWAFWHLLKDSKNLDAYQSLMYKKMRFLSLEKYFVKSCEKNEISFSH